jgi:NhaA family Na+:H+ antiporter
MSLFIGLLAFPDHPALQDQVKVGVLVGSIISGVAGSLALALGGSNSARTLPLRQG